MDLLSSSFSSQSTIEVISLTIMTDGMDGADHDGTNSADADRDDANNEDYQHFNRENATDSCDDLKPGNDGRISCM